MRSIAFAAAFVVVTALFLLIGSPLLLASRAMARRGLLAHAYAIDALLTLIAGVKFDVAGLENLPATPVLIAAKHQSPWDTIGLLRFVPRACYVMKASLLKIPVYGTFSRKFGMIPIERERGPSALRRMVSAARDRLGEGYDPLIFPEGTRRLPGAPPAYKPGILLLYDALKVPCVPIAVSSGAVWPRHSYRAGPGTIRVRVLEPIPPGLPREEFKARLETAIETANAELDRLAGYPPAPAAP